MPLVFNLDVCFSCPLLPDIHERSVLFCQFKMLKRLRTRAVRWKRRALVARRHQRRARVATLRRIRDIREEVAGTARGFPRSSAACSCVVGARACRRVLDRTTMALGTFIQPASARAAIQATHGLGGLHAKSALELPALVLGPCKECEGDHTRRRWGQWATRPKNDDKLTAKVIWRRCSRACRAKKEPVRVGQVCQDDKPRLVFVRYR